MLRHGRPAEPHHAEDSGEPEVSALGRPASTRFDCGVIVDGYVRVSRVGNRSGPSFLSPELQREAIRRWAELRGAIVAETFEELDESGGRCDRPLLEQAIRRIECHDSDGLVVAYMSRFGRS